ncbi:DUF945 family protein [Ideonella paludis]|uniref:DUF945 family protein n=1 Tax=Ideonella paludis TaxID=1233411 RepID=A0ABS5DTH9_9BURK|nr:DUF945 family protein [Ideonella paludis]MBQ0934191.1 DUF945 family protein [Ideonella paludis]
MAMSKSLAALGGVAVVAGAAWVGSGVWAGMKAEDALKALHTAPQKPGTAWKITQLKHERGLLSSKGEAEVSFTPGCAADVGEDEKLVVKVAYTLAHLPLPTGAARFDWQATPQGDTADAFKELFGAANALSGAGSVGMTGAIYTDMKLPEVAMRKSRESVQITPSTGFLRVKDKALGFGWKMERAVVRSSGEAVEVKDIVLDVDLDNRFLGTGSARFAMAHVSTSAGTMEGFELSSKATEKGDRLDFTFTPSIKKIEAKGQVLSDMALEMAIKGLDTKSIETISTLFDASCGLDALTADESKRLGDALNTVLTKGFSMGIPTLKGKAKDGKIDGELLVEVQAAKGGKPSLEAQLKSSGRLDVGGQALTDEQRKMAVGLGAAVEQGDGLRASFEYADGLLKLNGRSIDASGFQAALRNADQAIALAMETLGSHTKVAKAPAQAPEPKEEVIAEAPAQAPSAAAPAEAPAAPTATAPAPAPAAAAECDTLNACVAQSLAAAKANDVEGVRKIASRIDALPKPDLGNKAVARQLNTAALEALKKEDFAGAVAQLRQAQKENPRDVEIAGNLGFALVKAGQAGEAQNVLQAALVLDPRRTSTWTPFAESLALGGKAEDAKAALWISFQWSGNREKSLAYYQDRAAKETNPLLNALYTHMAKVAAAAMAAQPVAAL